MRPRKAEVEAMVALLDAEHADIEQLAKQALALAWDLAAERKRYGLIIDQPGVGVTIHGPFESDSQVSKFIASFPFAGPERPRMLVSAMNGKDDDTTEATSA